MNLTKKLIFGLLLAGALFTTACGDGDKAPKAGDACEKAEDCGDALTCNTTSKKCEEKKKPGDKLANGKTCTAHDKCTSGFCDLAATDKKCADLPGDKTVDDGKTCTKKEQCKTTGATCTDNKCTPPAPKLGDGEACDAHDKCTSGFCDLDATDKKCKAKPNDGSVADGKTCSEAKQCTTANSTCTDNKCTPPKAKGENCTAHTECTTGFCDSTCKDAPTDGSVANGGTCAKSKQCTSGFCDVNTGKCAAPAMPKNCTASSECTAKEVCGVFMSGGMKICTPKCDADPDICPTSYPCGEVTTTEGGAKVQACGTT